jgi:hypothetical protein
MTQRFSEEYSVEPELGLARSQRLPSRGPAFGLNQRFSRTRTTTRMRTRMRRLGCWHVLGQTARQSFGPIERRKDEDVAASAQILGVPEPRPTDQNKLVAAGSGRPHFCQLSRYSAFGRHT